MKILVVLFLAAVNAILFRPALDNGFVFDDRFLFTGTHAMQGLTRQSVTEALTSTEMAMYAPLSRLSQVVDCQLYGSSPWGHHLTNLFVHTANSALLFWVLCAFTGATWRSAAVALLFAVHPLNVEPVAWVSGRADLLAGSFCWLTLLFWRAYLRRPSWLRALPAVCLFLLGMTSKVIIMTLPFALLLLDYWPLGRFGRPEADHPGGGSSARLQPERTGRITTLLLEKTGLLLVTATMVAVSILLLRRGISVVSTEHYPLPARVATSLVSYATYLGKTLWPAGLTVCYPHTWGDYAWWKPAGSALLLLGVTAGALRLAWRRPYLVIGWFWFLGTLLPVIGIYQARQYPLADRYAYLPLIGLFIVAVWGFADLARGRRWGNAACAAALAAVVAACLPASRAQVGTWKDDVTLFTHAVKVTRENSLAHFNLGVELRASGDRRGARGHLLEALRIRPDYAEARANLGNILVDEGDIAAGIEQYRQAVRFKPEVGINLGVALMSLGRVAEAEQEYRLVLYLNPRLPVAHMNLANLLSETRRVEEALTHYREAQRLSPGDADITFNLGLTLAAERRFSEAAAAYREALRLRPDHPRARQCLQALPSAFK